MLVALGMPALIGGTGFAVDTAQWYMWKRELQFAVDQAAIAGAWARAEKDTEGTYKTRAAQEFTTNVQKTDGFVSSPTVALANYAGGVANSVAVSATATKKLPFSSFLTKKSTTIYAYAQASFDEGKTFTSCLIATDDSATGAVTIGGSSVLTASCGIAALSNSDEAIVVNGNPEVAAGWILARGGIDDYLKENTDDEILEYLEGLYDPFEKLSPPNPTESQVARTYTCNSTAGTTTADKTETVTISYSYYKGSNRSNATPHNYNNPRSGSTTTNTTYGTTAPAGTTEGQTSTSSSQTWTQLSGSGSNKIWEVETRTTQTTYTNVQTQGSTASGTVIPGTYSQIKVACNTTFSTGVYIINGGGLEINGQHEVTGSNVMFVLKNGAYLKINGGAKINLTAIQASDLIARGVPAEDADKLAGMLVFEDRNSSGSNKNNINGNASTILNGTVYLPKSKLDFSGTASVTSQCLMIAAGQINITGGANMSTFCPSGMDGDITVVNTQPKIKLVA